MFQVTTRTESGGKITQPGVAKVPVSTCSSPLMAFFALPLGFFARQDGFSRSEIYERLDVLIPFAGNARSSPSWNAAILAVRIESIPSLGQSLSTYRRNRRNLGAL